MDGFGVRPVELAVHDAGAGADALQVVGVKGFDVAHAVLVREGAAEDVGENFHVLMAVRAESLSRADAVFVDDAQGAEAHVPGIVIGREGKGMGGVQPAVIGVAALVAVANRDHKCVLIQMLRLA